MFEGPVRGARPQGARSACDGRTDDGGRSPRWTDRSGSPGVHTGTGTEALVPASTWLVLPHLPKTVPGTFPWRPAATHHARFASRAPAVRRGHGPKVASAPLHRRTSLRGRTMGDHPSIVRRLPRRTRWTEAQGTRQQRPEDRPLPCSGEPRWGARPDGAWFLVASYQLASFRLRRFSRP
jgi:hypothetical protein